MPNFTNNTYGPTFTPTFQSQTQSPSTLAPTNPCPPSTITCPPVKTCPTVNCAEVPDGFNQFIAVMCLGAVLYGLLVIYGRAKTNLAQDSRKNNFMQVFAYGVAIDYFAGAYAISKGRTDPNFWALLLGSITIALLGSKYHSILTAQQQERAVAANAPTQHNFDLETQSGNATPVALSNAGMQANRTGARQSVNI